MAQPEVAPNVTTGITQVMLIKSGGATGGASSENPEGASPVYIHIFVTKNLLPFFQ